MYIHSKMAISLVLVWHLTTPDSTQGVIKVPSTHVCLFVGDFSSVLAFHPYVNGVFGNQKHRFLKMVPRANSSKTLAYCFPVDG